MKTTAKQYTLFAIGLHWWIALLIFIAFPLGIYMHDLPFSPTKLKLFSWHKWLGVTVFLFVVVRIYWRLRNSPPDLPDSIAPWQKRVTHVAHGLLYLLMVAIPLSGWLMSSAKGFQTVWFGVLPIPDLLGKDKELGNLLVTVHQTLNFSFLALLILHILAVLKHHFIDKDMILRRMLTNHRIKQ
jgi:cytochrome b561